MTNLTTARLQIAISLLLGCLLAAAGPAGAQTASSTFTASSSGTVGAPASSTTTAPIDGSPAPTPVTKAPETINCSGPVKISSMSVTDPSLPPQVVVSLDTRGLSC